MFEQQVARFLIIIVNDKLQAVVHKAEVNAGIELRRGLPLQIGIGRTTPVNACQT